jgi:ABC-type lipoprotein release transport system permease subunit
MLSPAPDLRTLLFTVTVAVMTAFLFGLVPALQSTRPDLAPTLKDQAGSLAGSARQARFRKSLVALQVALSLLLLVGAGLYGVMAYNVARRTREIGVRMALGAFGGDVVWLVLREALLLLAVGLIVGLPAALALGRYAQSQLFGVHFADPLTLLLAVSGLAVSATLAGVIPARRASRVDPIRALRYE